MSCPHERLPLLTEEDAVRLIRAHGMVLEHELDDSGDDGLLESLRSWNSQLNHQAFEEVMASIKVLGPQWSSSQSLSRPVMCGLWNIVSLGRGYVTNPDRAAHRKSHILDVHELNVEQRWLDAIDLAVQTFLECDDPVVAFTFYDELVNDRECC